MTKALLAAILFVVIAWEYAPARSGSFVYEDYKAVDACASSGLEGRTGTRALWCWQVHAQHAMISFHAVNLFLHVAATALVGLVVWTLTGQTTAALLAAAFMGVNAVNVEAVAYLSSRAELLAAIGVLGACLAALRGGWWIVLVPVSITLGVSGKETAIVALMLVPLVLWHQRGRVWALVAGLGGVLMAYEMLVRTWRWWEGGPGRIEWALVQGTALVRLLVMSIIPVGQTVDYDYATVPAVMRGFACAMLVAGLVWAWTQRTTRRLLVCGAAWVACAALPRLLVPTPRSIFPEHQFYLPLVGVALMLASVFVEADA